MSIKGLFYFIARTHLSYANCIVPDQTPSLAASVLVLYCLPVFLDRTLGINTLK